MNPDIEKYNQSLQPADAAICNKLAGLIDKQLVEAENKIWHSQPVWFLAGNPVVGYGKLKNCVRLLFWSGQSFEEEKLQKEGSFKAAEMRYVSADEIDEKDLKRWLKKAKDIQWDYKNIIKNRGKLFRL